MDRDICALDMEASAFLMLCNYLNIGCLGIVKGVSDLGDSMKGRDPDTYDNALKETAEAVRKWAIYRLKEVHWVIPEGTKLTSED